MPLMPCFRLVRRSKPGHRRFPFLGAALVEHGNAGSPDAYDAKLCGPISELVLRNRGAGPFGLLNIVDERCGGTFENIDDVIPPKERDDFMAGATGRLRASQSKV